MLVPPGSSWFFSCHDIESIHINTDVINTHVSKIVETLLSRNQAED